MSQTPGDVPRIDDWARLLDGRVAVVTGGGDGIGGAISRLFARHGAVLEIAEIDAERATSIARELDGAHASVLDVRDGAAVDTWAAEVLERRGRVDVLVNNVGDFRPLVPFHRSSPASWDEMLQVNFLHVLAVTRAFLPSMIEQRRGSIVNLHSVEGMRGFPMEPVYGALKAAVAKFTTDLAVGYGRRGIRVNGIGPDLTQSPQVDYTRGFEAHDHLWESWCPIGRLGWPEDQARVALFLASDMSSFVTGHNIPVDGGTQSGGGWFYSPSEGRFTNRPRGL